MDKKTIYGILNEAYFGAQPHEQQAIRALRWLLPGRGTFVDLGASLGQYSKAGVEIMQEGAVEGWPAARCGICPMTFGMQFSGRR